jgi:hypothetical protein
MFTNVPPEVTPEVQKQMAGDIDCRYNMSKCQSDISIRETCSRGTRNAKKNNKHNKNKGFLK